MFKYSTLLFVLFLSLFGSYVNCGPLTKTRSEYQGADNSRVRYLATKDGNTNAITSNGEEARSSYEYARTGGLSAWAIITLIIFVILLVMGGYYGVLCYPLVCRKETKNYYIMDRASTSTGTPTRSTEFEKFEKNYSSRSTTPSKSHE